MTNGWGRVSLVLAGLCLSGSLLSGCGSGVPIAFNRVVSPCIDMPKVMADETPMETRSKASMERLLQKDFENKDTDSNKELTPAEIKAGDTRPNLIDMEVFERLDAANKNKETKGKLTYDQVKGFAGTLYKWASYYKVKLLNRFDKDGDHFLVWEELKSNGETAYFGIEKAKFDGADENKDKRLDPDEFLDLVLAQNADVCGAAGAPSKDPADPAAKDGANTATSSVRRPYPQQRPLYRPAPPVYRPAPAPYPRH